MRRTVWTSEMVGDSQPREKWDRLVSEGHTFPHFCARIQTYPNLSHYPSACNRIWKTLMFAIGAQHWMCHPVLEIRICLFRNVLILFLNCSEIEGNVLIDQRFYTENIILKFKINGWKAKIKWNWFVFSCLLDLFFTKTRCLNINALLM